MFRRRINICLQAALLLLMAVMTPRSFAHPMGNFSVNHYSKISLENTTVRVSYIIDLAEIPTYQELQAGNITANAADAAVTRYVEARGVAFGDGLKLLIDGRQAPLHLVSSQVIFPAGAGGLPTMKMGFVYQADYPPAADHSTGALEYTDGNYPGHAGWKEIIVAAPMSQTAPETGRVIHSSVQQTDRSAGLSNYPTDLLNSPPQDLNATVQFRYPATVAPTTNAAVAAPPATVAAGAHAPAKVNGHATVAVMSTTSVGDHHSVGRAPGHSVGRSMDAPAHDAVPGSGQSSLHGSAGQPQSGAPPLIQAPPVETLHLQANQQATPRNAFTELIATRTMSFWFLITAAFIAMGLGALHALEPGHGKTIVAAYLVGSRGTARHAFLLGMIVTVSHTAGVFALGAITLYASRYIVPEQLYPWLGVCSGLTIAGLGGYMFLRRWTGLDLDHAHTAGQMHGHWFSSKSERPATPQPAVPAKNVSLSQLFALGITGGIIPCPAALVVLLSAFTLHRIGLGFFLIIAFSLGLAGVLIGFGMLMVYGRHFMARLQVDGPLTRRWLPVASAAFMTLLGAGIAVRAFLTTGIEVHHLSKEKLGPFLFIGGLGLLLGMRHSTDPDHVVAVSTIVSKQRSIRSAGLIGTIWGLGHTLTIFAVGSMIILFGVVIPPRVGLSMEFSVGLMLILLGVLNLTGVMQRVTSYLTRGRKKKDFREELKHFRNSCRPASPQRAKLPVFTWFSLKENHTSLLLPDQSHCENALSSRTESLLDRWLVGSPVQALDRFGIYQCVRPLVIGIVHGLAGSAAVALLVLSTIHNPLWATVYLLIFGAGTMVGMMGMTSVMALPLAYAGKRFAGMSRVFSVASGVVSVCFGFFLVYQLGFLGGLFTSHPQWTPR